MIISVVLWFGEFSSVTDLVDVYIELEVWNG